MGRGAGTGESAPREGVNAGELALILSYAPYSNRETGPCTLLGQDSETGPGGVIMGEPDLKTQKQENWTICCRLQMGGLAKAVLSPQR